MDVFRDENGNSRILSIWDQTIQEGNPPEGYLYGTEYTREDINRALQSQNPYDVVPSRDEIGHGSIMAALAAASSVNSRPYVGAAPDADIVVVKLKECKPHLRSYYFVREGVPAYQENDIMLALKYADSIVERFKCPVVICLGLGTNMGDHAGSSFLSGYMDRVAVRRSRAVVVCGGNEGNTAHHFQGSLRQAALDVRNTAFGMGPFTDVSGLGAAYQDVEIRVEDGHAGFLLELWCNLPDVMSVSVRTPGGESIPPIRLGTRQSITYGFIYERTQVTVDASLVESSSGAELILFRFKNPTPGIWTFRVSSQGEIYNGIFHLWLPLKEFMNAEAYFLASSPYVTLTEPAMAQNVISVTSYNADNNSFYIESGRGFSRIGSICPDIAAPGVNVSTIAGEQSGSSLAAAITAGAMAQFMQWAVTERNAEFAESRQIKSYLIRGADRDADMVYPNREWGYGRLNLMGTFEAIRDI